jgi:hypothetical protein
MPRRKRSRRLRPVDGATSVPEPMDPRPSVEEIELRSWHSTDVVPRQPVMRETQWREAQSRPLVVPPQGPESPVSPARVVAVLAMLGVLGWVAGALFLHWFSPSRESSTTATNVVSEVPAPSRSTASPAPSPVPQSVPPALPAPAPVAPLPPAPRAPAPATPAKPPKAHHRTAPRSAAPASPVYPRQQYGPPQYYYYGGGLLGGTLPSLLPGTFSPMSHSHAHTFHSYHSGGFVGGLLGAGHAYGGLLDLSGLGGL